MPNAAIVGAGLIGCCLGAMFSPAPAGTCASGTRSRTSEPPRPTASPLRSTNWHAMGWSTDAAAAAARVSVWPRSRPQSRSPSSCRRVGPRRSRPSAPPSRRWTRSRRRRRSSPPRPRRSSPRSSPRRCRAQALHRRASGQSAAPGSGGRAVRGAVDIRGDAPPRARGVRKRRPGSDRREARDRRLHPEPVAGRAADRGVPPGAGRLCQSAGSRPHRSATDWDCAGPSWARSRRSN